MTYRHRQRQAIDRYRDSLRQIKETENGETDSETQRGSSGRDRVYEKEKGKQTSNPADRYMTDRQTERDKEKDTQRRKHAYR